MERLYIQTLGIVVTEECNMNCAHCLRGEKGKHKIEDYIIEEIFNQVDAIGHLAICGGEPTLAVDRIAKIIDIAIRKNVLIDGFSTIINGLYYSKPFLDQLEYIESYLNLISRDDGIHTTFNISDDEYHKKELEKYGMLEKYYQNIEMYQRSPYFGQMQGLTTGLIKEGNAKNLNNPDIKDFVPSQWYRTDFGGMTNVGSLITIDTYGNITECDASIKDQQGKYNYGNVLCDSIIDVCKKRAKVLDNNEWKKKCLKKIN